MPVNSLLPSYVAGIGRRPRSESTPWEVNGNIDEKRQAGYDLRKLGAWGFLYSSIYFQIYMCLNFFHSKTL